MRGMALVSGLLLGVASPAAAQEMAPFDAWMPPAPEAARDAESDGARPTLDEVPPPPAADTGSARHPRAATPSSPYVLPGAEETRGRSSVGAFRAARNRDGAPTAVQLGFTFGASDWARTPFRQRNTTLRLQGEELELGRLDATGFDVLFHYLGRRPWVLGVGMTYGTPAGGGARNVEVLGPSARIDRLHLFRWYAEVGAAHRFGDLEVFAVGHLGVQRAVVEVSAPEKLLIASRPTLGPRAGFRARVHRVLFLHASVYMDTLVWPGSLVTVGLAVGPTGRLLAAR